MSERDEAERCRTCGDPATQWDYDQMEYFCDRHVQQADFTVAIAGPLPHLPLKLRQCCRDAAARAREEERELAAKECDAWAAANIEAFREQALAAECCARRIRQRGAKAGTE